MTHQSATGLKIDTLNVESLVAAISEDVPCGENLEDSNEFRQIEIELKKVNQARRSFGSGPTVKCDWQKVRELSLKLLERSKDLRLCISLAAASLRKPGADLSEFTKVLAIIQELVKMRWDTVHPQPNSSDKAKPYRGRVQCIEELSTGVYNQADDYKIIEQLRLIPLTRSGQGPQFCHRDIMILRDHLEVSGDEKQNLIKEKKNETTLKSAFAFTVNKARTQLEDLASDTHRAAVHVDEISKQFRQMAGEKNTPDLGLLKSELLAIAEEIENHLGFKTKISDAPKEKKAESAAGISDNPCSAPVGVISSREEVLQAIDRIQDYYKQHEPSSPVPLLLQRARRLATMSFVDIVHDIAGDAVKNMKVLLGPETTKE